MNRRTLTYPIAALAVAAVLVCGWLQTAAAQNVSERPSPPEDFKIFRLRYVNTAIASSALYGLMGADERASMRMAPCSNGTLLISAPPEAYKKIDEVLKAIDVAPAAEPESQIKIFRLVNAEPASAAHLLATLLPKNSHISFAVDDRTRSLVASGSRDSLAVAEAVLTKLDERANLERPKSSVSYEVRILWLVNDKKGAPPADDLKDVVAELSRLGVKDVRQVGQMVVQTSLGQSFDLSSVPDFAGQPAKLTASGRLSERSEGSVEMRVSIRAAAMPWGPSGQQQQVLSELSTRIVLPQKQYVVLATAPVGKITSVFVVQVTGRTKAGERK